MKPMPRGDAGFTLLEILIATALLALLTGLVFWGVRFGAQSWTTVNARTAATADSASVGDLFRRTIRQAYPAFLAADLSDRRVAFEGDSETLALSAPLPDAIEPGVMAWQRFFLAEEHGQRSLYFAWRLDLPAADGRNGLPENRAKLAESIRSIRFAYFGAINPGDPPQWFDRWSGQASPPELVRIRIESADPRGPIWPDIIVQPRSTTSTACVYDPTDASCRRIR